MKAKEDSGKAENFLNQGGKRLWVETFLAFFFTTFRLSYHFLFLEVLN